jgi:hypothetical protein
MMRGVHVAILAVAGLLLGSFASAQGLGDVAAEEKKKRKDAPAAKVYTENDLGPSMAPVSSLPETLPATPEDAEEGTEGDSEEADAGDAALEEEDRRAQAEEAWRQKLDRARKEEEVYQDIIDRLQLELNDISGGVNTPSRANRVAFLEENKQLLAEVQGRIATLEEEGRVNRYR